jgi:hypothetical protein
MFTEIESKSNRSYVPWNKGRLVGQKRPLRPKDVWAIRIRLQIETRKRDLAMFNLAIDSKLRGCDLVSLRIDDVATGGHVKDRATIVQHKTGRLVQFEITGADPRLAARLVERATGRSRSLRFPEPGTGSAPSDRSPIRAYRPRLARAHGNGQHLLRQAFDAAH